MRDEKLDIKKGILAFLVILGHCILYGSIDQQTLIQSKSFILRFIYTFHMPLFMLMCGYFTAKSFEKYKLKLIVNRIVILFPLVWIAIISSIGSLKYGIIKYASVCLYKFLINIWFVWAVFWLTIVVSMVYSVLSVIKCNVYVRAVIYILIICMASFLPNKYNLANYVFMMPYMFAGFEIGISGKDINAIKIPKIINVIVFLTAVLLVINYNQMYMIHVGNLSLSETNDIVKQIFINMYRWVTGIVVSYVWWKSVNWLIGKFNKATVFFKTIGKIGRLSMEIYVIHIYLLSILKKMAKLLSIHYYFPIALMESLIILGITLSIIFVLKKTNVYNLIFIKTKILKISEIKNRKGTER